VPAEYTLILQNHLDVPFPLESPNALMLTEVGKGEICGIGWWGKCDLNDAGLILTIQTAVRGVGTLVRCRELLERLEEIGQAEL